TRRGVRRRGRDAPARRGDRTAASRDLAAQSSAETSAVLARRRPEPIFLPNARLSVPPAEMVRPSNAWGERVTSTASEQPTSQLWPELRKRPFPAVLVLPPRPVCGAGGLRAGSGIGFGRPIGGYGRF